MVITYLPYLLITAFYFWSRIFYFPVVFQTTSRMGGLNELLTGFREAFGETLSFFFNQALFDLIYLTLQVWINAIINFEGFTFQNRVAWFAFGLGAALAIAFAFFHDTDENEIQDNSSPASLLLAGFVLFVLGALQSGQSANRSVQAPGTIALHLLPCWELH